MQIFAQLLDVIGGTIKVKLQDICEEYRHIIRFLDGGEGSEIDAIGE
jgi:hypothetical protein